MTKIDQMRLGHVISCKVISSLSYLVLNGTPPISHDVEPSEIRSTTKEATDYTVTHSSDDTVF